jgi:hypothetical protein
MTDEELATQYAERIRIGLDAFALDPAYAIDIAAAAGKLSLQRDGVARYQGATDGTVVR